MPAGSISRPHLYLMTYTYFLSRILWISVLIDGWNFLLEIINHDHRIAPAAALIVHGFYPIPHQHRHHVRCDNLYISKSKLILQRNLSDKLTVLLNNHDPSAIELNSDPNVTETAVQQSAAATSTIRIALTREAGNNSKLLQAITDHPLVIEKDIHINLKLIEIPCIEFKPGGPDFDCFKKLLMNPEILQRTYDYIVITSPESANVFYQAISSSQHEYEQEKVHVQTLLPTSIQIAAVGKATQRQLQKYGFPVHFVPSKADGETLATELPAITVRGMQSESWNHDKKMNCTRVLYPASAKAADTIQKHLETKRKDASFQVTRLNTYDTVAAVLDKTILLEFIQPSATESSYSTTPHTPTNIACFGSPSAVEAWLQNVDSVIHSNAYPINGNVLAVCIGQTTATACQESKRWSPSEIFYPIKNPGIEGWAESCISAIQYILRNEMK